MEPHIVAIHNTLRRRNHKLFTFFKPMVQDTLLLGCKYISKIFLLDHSKHVIQYLSLLVSSLFAVAARRTLSSFGADSFGDRMTSVGSKSLLASLSTRIFAQTYPNNFFFPTAGQFMQLINRYWSSYDFFKSSSLPDELASRGFDEDLDMPAYLYREDGIKLWDIYEKFASNFVDEIYANDQEIVDDKVLQEWAQETSSPDSAAVKGFPKRFEDKTMLVKAMQTIWWICSGLHAAVNFPQYDCYGFTPNKPLNMRQGTKQYEESRDNNSGIRDWIFANAMPNLDAAKEAIQVTRVLTLPSKHTIDKLHENFQDLGHESYELFLIDLDKLGKKIDNRNKENREKGKPVYNYLHPTVVPASIDI